MRRGVVETVSDLAADPGRSVYADCNCGHSGTIDLKAVVAKFGAALTIDGMLARLRCANCGKRVNRRNIRLVHDGIPRDKGEWR